MDAVKAFNAEVSDEWFLIWNMDLVHSKVRQLQALQILQATENCFMATKINKPNPFLKLHRITVCDSVFVTGPIINIGL